MPPKKTKPSTEGAGIAILSRVSLKVRIRGISGLYIQRLSDKAKRGLLAGSRKKTASERAAIKHNPVEEFRSCLYHFPGRHPNTELFMPASAIRGAIGTAALETDGVTKTAVKRLTFIRDEFIPIFGVPLLKMDVVRDASVSRTPDIRTRPYFETWGSEFEIQYGSPRLTERDMLGLIANAGVFCGIGDFRQEKGGGSYGCWEILADADEHDKTILDIKAQRKALASPTPADDQTSELMVWLAEEIKARGEAA